MSFIEKLKALLIGARHEQSEAKHTELIYIMLPEPLQPTDRGTKYEDPLDAELRLAKLGYVSGGGSSLSEEVPDGTREIEWCGIDVDTTDVDQARALLRQNLPELGCLKGSALQFRKGDIPLQDEFDGVGWQLDLPRTQMHPGFGA
jgi:hypothetical protein